MTDIRIEKRRKKNREKRHEIKISRKIKNIKKNR
jgi:hypothetical protein